MNVSKANDYTYKKQKLYFLFGIYIVNTPNPKSQYIMFYRFYFLKVMIFQDLNLLFCTFTHLTSTPEDKRFSILPPFPFVHLADSFSFHWITSVLIINSSCRFNGFIEERQRKEHINVVQQQKVILISVTIIPKCHIKRKGRTFQYEVLLSSFYSHRRTCLLLYPFFFFRFFADSTASATTGLLANRLVQPV